MSELVYELNPKKPEGPELFPKRDLLESLRPEQLQDFINDCFNKQREIQECIDLAIDVMENGYGYDRGDAA